jgi:hypothetical protein
MDMAVLAQQKTIHIVTEPNSVNGYEWIIPYVVSDGIMALVLFLSVYPFNPYQLIMTAIR